MFIAMIREKRFSGHAIAAGEKKKPTLAFPSVPGFIFPINVSRKKKKVLLVHNSFFGEKKHILLHKDLEHKRTMLDVVCRLVDYSFTKHNYGMHCRPTATCEKIKGSKHTFLNACS